MESHVDSSCFAMIWWLKRKAKKKKKEMKSYMVVKDQRCVLKLDLWPSQGWPCGCQHDLIAWNSLHVLSWTSKKLKKTWQLNKQELNRIWQNKTDKILWHCSIQTPHGHLGWPVVVNKTLASLKSLDVGLTIYSYWLIGWNLSLVAFDSGGKWLSGFQ